MPLPSHRVSIYKQMGSEEWSNDWLLNVTSMDDANDVGDALLEFERHMHSTIITFTYMRISTTAVGDRTFRHIPINQQGLINMEGAETLPLFNTLRVDLSTLDSDPARKYFRCPLSEGMQDGGNLLSTTITNFNGNITSYLANTIALDNIVTTKGNTVSGATVYPYVQMRQLERRRKKKVVE